MKLLGLALSIMATLASSAMADNKITCEGILEHGSGGEYIASENKPTCWLGGRRPNRLEADLDFEDVALAVCKLGEHCKITGASTTCAKDPDPHSCQEIIRLDSISR